jgi:hypothetical protein
MVAIAGTIVLLGLALVWTRNHSRLAAPAPSLDKLRQELASQDPLQVNRNGRQTPGGPYVSSDPRWNTVREKEKTDPNWEWRTSINFYGRVLDENERPVSDAKVDAQWSDLSATGASSGMVLTDAEGLFAITGKTGRGITIRIVKEGYYTPRRQQTSFDFAAFWEANYYEPDPANPAIFHLRKKGESETLNAGEVQPSVAADGTPVRLDLLSAGRVSPSGQLEITAITNTEKYPPAKFDWRASLIVPEGGLIEHHVEFPFEAPAEGYQPKVEIEMPANSPDWRRSIEKHYFIRFGNPTRYGRIRIRFNGATQRAFLRFAVNPTGSRGLEGNDEF